MQKHFGNSLTAEEVIRDLIDFSLPVEYIGIQREIKHVGHYQNGQFIQTGSRETTNEFKLFLMDNGKWRLTKIDGDSGVFESDKQAKSRAKYLYGNAIKWTVTKSN